MIGWFDCTAGASGDMILGAVVDAGASVERIHAAIAALSVEPIQLEVSTVDRHGIGATKVDVITPRSTVSRTWANIRDRIEQAGLDDWVTAITLDAYSRLADASADAHRGRPQQVHFHELGGLDSIVDIVGAATGLHELGVRSLSASTVTVGTGMAHGEHGLVAVPSPAVVSLLQSVAAPVWSGPAPYEMCTPTGAALLASTVSEWGPLPPMVVSRAGHGAGSRDLDEIPNVLRLLIGEPVGVDRDGVTGTETVLEANVDDLDPRLWPGIIDALLAAGAADAWLTPITMKKGRPAHTLSVLAPAAALDDVRDTIFGTSSTIGVREYPVHKHALDREQTTVTVEGEPVGVKIARLRGRVVNVSVEYDDVRRAAERTGRPVKEMLRAATAAAYDRVETT